MLLFSYKWFYVANLTVDLWKLVNRVNCCVILIVLTEYADSKSPKFRGDITRNGVRIYYVFVLQKFSAYIY